MSIELIHGMLSPLEEYYSHPDHEEIAINQPGEIWCRRHRPDANGCIWVRGSALDFEKTLVFSGFKFKNPQEASRCGCGHSFTVR